MYGLAKYAVLIPVIAQGIPTPTTSIYKSELLSLSLSKYTAFIIGYSGPRLRKLS